MHCPLAKPCHRSVINDNYVPWICLYSHSLRIFDPDSVLGVALVKDGKGHSLELGGFSDMTALQRHFRLARLRHRTRGASGDTLQLVDLPMSLYNGILTVNRMKLGRSDEAYKCIYCQKKT